MPETSRPHDVTGLTAGELDRARRELQRALAPARPESPARCVILAHLNAINAELAERAGQCPAM